MRGSRLLVGWVLVTILAVKGSSQTTGANASAASNAAGNEVCAGCHAEIYTSYKKTVMATASGAAVDGVITGEFLHKPSGVRYRVYEKDGPRPPRSAQDAGCARGTDACALPHTAATSSRTVWMSYEREKENGFRGERELLYFIGSGVKGRSYLLSEQGFLFETPINWYAQEQRWNMTPAYTEARESPMNLPALVDCLNCHSSGLQAPMAGTDNKFLGEPFFHGGITCQRCHGASKGHGRDADVAWARATSQGASGAGSVRADAGCAPGTDECVRSNVVNPGELTAERRDAICVECHFEGTVAVEQPGKHLYQFQPGQRLEDYIHYFLLEGKPS